MIDQILRLPKEKLLRPVAKHFNISPGIITGLGLVTGLLAALMASRGWYGFALLFWLLNRLLDGLDGEIARVHGRQTDLGAYFDIMADLLIYALLPLALVLSQLEPKSWLALSALISSFYINAGSWMYLASLLEKRGLGARQKQEKTGITMPGGLIEGGETLLFFTAFLILPQHLAFLFWSMTLLICITIVQRLHWASKHL